MIGHVKDAPVYNGDLEQAHTEWQVLNRNVAVEVNDRYTGEPHLEPISEKMWGNKLTNAINEKPELFMLLRREARDAGVRIDNDQLNEIMANNFRPSPEPDDAVEELARDAVTDMLLIQSNFVRLASDVKVSQPYRDEMLAKYLQNIRLNVVEIPASDYASKLPPPTTQQMQEQFDKFANIDPGVPDPEKNPFGFGYRLPDRVKLQFLAIRRDEVQAAVEKSKTPYDWEVQARLYYRQHHDEFPATQPAAPTTQNLASSQPSTAPAYKPFEEVSKEAIDRVRTPIVDKLMADIQGRIAGVMSSGWHAYSESVATTQPGGAAASSPAGSDYPSYTFLRNLADSIQQQYGVHIYVTDRQNGYLSEKDLPMLEGIGQAFDNPMSEQAVPFATLTMQRARTFLARPDKDTPQARAQLMQPSMPLQDYMQNVYVYRLTDARAAEPAPSLADVSVKVEADLRTQQGFEKAKEAAGPLLAAARNGTLGGAAGAIGKSTTTTESFNAGSRSFGLNITMSESGTAAFKDQAFRLLSQYNPSTNAHPVELIELPQDGKIYIAQLQDISTDVDKNQAFEASIQVTAMLRNDLMAGLIQDWFSYDAVVKRMDYKPVPPKSTGS